MKRFKNAFDAELWELTEENDQSLKFNYKLDSDVTVELLDKLPDFYTEMEIIGRMPTSEIKWNIAYKSDSKVFVIFTADKMNVPSVMFTSKSQSGFDVIQSIANDFLVELAGVIPSTKTFMMNGVKVETDFWENKPGYLEHGDVHGSICQVRDSVLKKIEKEYNQFECIEKCDGYTRYRIGKNDFQVWVTNRFILQAYGNNFDVRNTVKEA